MKIVTLLFLIVGIVSLDSANAARDTLSLNGPWLFCVDSLNQGEISNFSNGLPADLVNKVSVPHTWNIMNGLEDYAGKAWYSRTFSVSPEWKKKDIQLKFSAVYRDAVVYLNGKKVGEHMHSGYTAFSVNISDFVKYNAQNLLVVSVSNAFSADALPYKESFDWPNDGGIIRDVNMIVADRPSIRYVHITPSIDGKVNVRVKCWDDKLKSAGFRIQVKERNSGKQVANLSQKSNAVNGIFSFQFIISEPKLWHFDRPNLYDIEVSSLLKGKVADTEKQHFGFREIKQTGDSLYLNGEPVRLPGIEWMPGSNPSYGMAEPKQFIDSVLSDLKILNSIITRFHWQQDNHTLDWMDEHGILVMEEVPWWQQPMDYGEKQYAIHKQHIEEMIDQDYNHPSIFAWGLGNEVWGQDERVKKAFTELKRFTRQIDSSRFISFVSNSLSYGPAKDVSVLSDMLTWNEYIGTWHGKNRNELPGNFQQIQKEVPDRALFITEHGLCEPRFTGGDARRIDEMIFHYNEWAKQPWVAGTIYFSYNDYRTHRGEEGTGKFKRRVHGITGNYMERKPSFYTLQQLQSPIEILNITRKNNNYLLLIRCKNTLPAYSVVNYSLQAGSIKIVIPDLKPGESTTLSLPSDTREIRILRPTGSEVLRHRIN